jgi:hypothetical protein
VLRNQPAPRGARQIFFFTKEKKMGNASFSRHHATRSGSQTRAGLCKKLKKKKKSGNLAPRRDPRVMLQKKKTRKNWKRDH